MAQLINGFFHLIGFNDTPEVIYLEKDCSSVGFRYQPYTMFNRNNLAFFAVGMITALAMRYIVPRAFSLSSNLYHRLIKKEEKRLSDEEKPIFIPNINTLKSDELAERTRGNKIKYILEEDKKVHAEINCRGLSDRKLNLILEELKKMFPELNGIIFLNLENSAENLASSLQSFKNLHRITYSNCKKVSKSKIDLVLHSNTKIMHIEFKNGSEIDPALCREWERDHIVTYNDGSSNKALFLQAFRRDLEALDRNMTRADICAFLESLKTKPYYAVFYVSFDLCLNDLPYCNDEFTSLLFDYFGKNNFSLVGLNLSNTSLTGNSLNLLIGLPIRRLILKKVARFDFANLALLKSFSFLSKLDLSDNHQLFDEDFPKVSSIKSLKALLLNNCENVSVDLLEKSILTLLDSLEYVSLEKTAIERRSVQKLLAAKNIQQPFVMVTTIENTRTIHFHGCDGIDRNTIDHIRSIPENIIKVVFDGKMRLYFDDMERLLACDNLHLEELDLRNLNIENYKKEELEKEQREVSEQRPAFRKMSFAKAAHLAKTMRRRPQRKGLEKEGAITEEGISKLDILLKLNILSKWPLKRLIIEEFEINIQRSPLITVTVNVLGGSIVPVCEFIKKFESLEELSFSGYQQVDENDLNAIAQIVKKVNIKTLNLSNTNIDNDDLQSFEESPKEAVLNILKKIRVIDLKGTKVNKILFTAWPRQEKPQLIILQGGIGNNPSVDILVQPHGAERPLTLRIVNDETLSVPLL